MATSLYWFLCFMALSILQWNARSLYANGIEFKSHVNLLKPDIICVQETFLNGKYSFTLPSYNCIRRDRSDGSHRGGVATFVKNNISFVVDNMGKNLESLTVKVKHKYEINIVNIYCPDNNIDLEEFKQLMSIPNAFICGDFNGHNTLWGSPCNDKWGKDIEKIVNENNLVVLNDGSGTREDVSRGAFSHIDLTLTTPNFASKCHWEVSDVNCGSDHFMIQINLNIIATNEDINVPKWNFKKAKWVEFRSMCDKEILLYEFSDDLNQFNNELTNIIIKIADKCIPKVKYREKNPVPFWNDKCTNAINERKKARRKVQRSRNPRDLITFNKAKAVARRTLKREKKQYWEKYCSTLSYKTNINKVWDTVRGLSNVGKSRALPQLKEGNNAVLDNKIKADLLAKQFAYVSSNANYTDTFLRHKEIFENENKHLFQKQENTDEVYNDNFSLSDLFQALESCKNTSPGGDQLCYVMFTHMSEGCLHKILDLFNKVWDNGIVPDKWKEAIIIPILKPGKDKALPVSYRPIALTSNLSKLMERMITNRLFWFLEKNNLINYNQSGFRKNRRTLDHLIRLSDTVNKSLATKQNTLAVFLDIEKAYDMVWRKGILYKLHKLGVSGNMINWINDFLHNRSIKVRVGDKLSDKQCIDNGTPQGSAISPLLFLVAINDIKVDGVDLSIFADDTAIWKSGPNLAFLERKIQKALDDINKWCDLWGFRISIAKTQVMLFTKKRKYDIQLKYDGNILTMAKSAKFLGLYFDSKMSWRKHIEYIIDKCKCRVNLLRCIAGNEWGACKTTLCNIYKALIRARIDYGAEIYFNACPSLLQKLDLIQNRCLRICTRAFKGTPNCALEVDCGVMPLDIRRQKLQANIVATYKQSENNPVVRCLEDSWHEQYSKSKKFKTIWSNVTEFNNNADLYIDVNKVVQFPIWNMVTPLVDVTVSTKITKKDPIPMQKAVAMEYISKWENHLHIYTDGSKTKGKCSAAFYIPDLKVTKGFRIDDFGSNYDAEIVAIIQSLVWLEDKNIAQSIIFSDSLSVLQAISSRKINKSPLLKELFYWLYNLQQSHTVVNFAWIPSHVGINGNEVADAKAKAHVSEYIEVKLMKGKNQVYKSIDDIALDVWQDRWQLEEKGRFFYSINDTVSNKVSFVDENRKKETILTRLRFGKCWLNEFRYLLNKSNSPLCEVCLVVENVEHFLTDCVKHFSLSLVLTDILRKKKEKIDIKNILNDRECLNYIWKYCCENKIYI